MTDKPPVYQPQPSGYGQGQVNPGFSQPQVGYSQPMGYGQNTNTTVMMNQPGAHLHQGIRPPDYLILSIVAIFFFWPLAICAIMFSLNSRSAADCGDMVTAAAKGRTARNLGIAAIVFSLVLIIVVIIMQVVVFGSVTAAYTPDICFNC